MSKMIAAEAYGPDCVDTIIHEPGGKFWRGFKEWALIRQTRTLEISQEMTPRKVATWEGWNVKAIQYTEFFVDGERRRYKKAVVTYGKRYNHRHIFLSDPV